MPYIVASILRANEIFAPLEGFNPEALLGALREVETVREGIELLGLTDAIEYPGNAEVLIEFLDGLPPSLDASILAGLRSALSRGLRTQFTWKPGYAFDLTLWESSDQLADGKWVGLVNFLIVSPDPVEVQDAKAD